MKLYLDSTSAQAIIIRLGPGRSKHISTRLLWSQQALRQTWFKVGRISTERNVADLNTKALALRRRQPFFGDVDAEVTEFPKTKEMKFNLVDNSGY